jgi:hypothetical protein
MHAAFAGRVDVLEWALAEGAPWDSANVFLCAKWGTQARVLRWGVLTRGASLWCAACVDRVTPCRACCRYLWAIRSTGEKRIEAELQAAGFPFGYPGPAGAFGWEPARGECRVWSRAPPRAARPRPIKPGAGAS